MNLLPPPPPLPSFDPSVDLVVKTIKSENTKTWTVDSFALVLTTLRVARRVGIELEKAEEEGEGFGERCWESEGEKVELSLSL